MSIHQSYAVFGLGRYGRAVAEKLIDDGAEVLAVDRNPAIVNALGAKFPLCKCADVTDSEVIKQLGISNMDVVIIAMGGSLEASVLAIMLCKEAGVPTVIAKCSSEIHQKILLRVGADKVVFPERESGIRLAKNLLSSGFTDLVDLSQNISMIELDVPTEWVGRSLRELNLRQKHSVNVIAIRDGRSVSMDIDPAALLTASMKLIVVADTEKLHKWIGSIKKG